VLLKSKIMAPHFVIELPQMAREDKMQNQAAEHLQQFSTVRYIVPEKYIDGVE
jgi:hypothetical protein